MSRTVTLKNLSNVALDVVVLDDESSDSLWFDSYESARTRRTVLMCDLRNVGDICSVAVRQAGAAWFCAIVHNHEGLDCGGSVSMPEFCHPDARVVTGDNESLVCSVCGSPA
jgi:hypothetical protein